MGCDVHMFFEYRMPGQDWQLDKHHIPKNAYQAEHGSTGLNEIALGRNYYMFGILAGVRGNACLYPPRGFPDTASPELTEAWKLNGEHTPTYLTLKEMVRCIKACRKYQMSTKKFKFHKKAKNIFDNPKDDGMNACKVVSYTDVVSYAHHFIKNNTTVCLDGLIDIKPEVRFVFWFDS